jgi:anti-anti-sigma factor
VAGEIDMATSLNLEVVLLVTIETTTARRVTVDLANVTFIDAAGVDALVAGHEAARRCGVGFTVENARGIVLRVLDILGLSELLQQSPARP